MVHTIGFEPINLPPVLRALSVQLSVDKWCPDLVSNQGPTACRAVALPLSYRGLVAKTGFKPAINGLKNRLLYQFAYLAMVSRVGLEPTMIACM